MKILFIIDSLRPGGAERQLVELIVGLNSLGHNLHLICLNRTDEGYTNDVESAEIGITYIQRKHSYDVSVLFRIWLVILKGRFDLVHTFNNLGSLIGALAARMAAVPVVCSAIRDAKDKNYIYRYTKLVLSRIANVLVSNSQAGFDNRFSERRPNFRVVYNGINTENIQPPLPAIKVVQRLALNSNIDPNAPWLGMVASLSDHKDHRTFLAAARLVLMAYPQTQILVIGDGPRRGALETLVAEMGIVESVHFLGHRSDARQLGGLLDVAVLMTNSCVHQEGISNSLMETMLQGVPVIASSGGGTDELLDHGSVGILVQPFCTEQAAASILQLLSDPIEAKRLGSLARQHIEQKFGLQRYIDDYVAIYTEILQINEAAVRRR